MEWLHSGGKEGAVICGWTAATADKGESEVASLQALLAGSDHSEDSGRALWRGGGWEAE